MKPLTFLISCCLLMACNDQLKTSPAPQQISNTQKSPEKNQTETTAIIQNSSSTLPVSANAPSFADPVWNKILVGGLSAQKSRLLRDRVEQMLSEGRSSEAWIAVNSLPLGKIRDDLAAELFRTIPLADLIRFLDGSVALSPEDETTLSRSIPFRAISPDDAPVDYSCLANVTKSQSLREDLLVRASFNISTLEEWEAIASKGLSGQGLIRAASNAFAKLRQSDPEYLKNLVSSQKISGGVRDEAAKAYSLLLLESSPEQAVKFIEAAGSIPAADQLYQTWLKQDPAAATSWMKTTSGSKFYRTLVMRTVTYAESNNEKETAAAWMDVLLSLGPPK